MGTINDYETEQFIKQVICSAHFKQIVVQSFTQPTDELFGPFYETQENDSAELSEALLLFCV